MGILSRGLWCIEYSFRVLSIEEAAKSDAEHHGMDLTNIRNVVKPYDGQMNVNCKNNYVEFSIALKLLPA